MKNQNDKRHESDDFESPSFNLDAEDTDYQEDLDYQDDRDYRDEADFEEDFSTQRKRENPAAYEYSTPEGNVEVGEKEKKSPKKVLLTAIFIILFVLAIFGVLYIYNLVQSGKNNMETPLEASNTLLETVADEDKAAFNNLLDGAKIDADIDEVYSQLQKADKTSDDSMLSNFVLIRLENGKAYLCSFYYNKETEQYNFRSISEVPQEQQAFFAR